ncbi:hypothetical protein RDV89_18915 [Nocardioides zeae]|uniref:VTT domain-containing protein n=1 Tax=Nocardioides imazamoxiresistens TaxID=3231893 RepID=A0ABU3Q2A5_9ACTN|nr:hypothetical protein [Nocardioides zeae]MDT9595167.1 hypothetical protein [Nocardioides zeae]
MSVGSALIPLINIEAYLVGIGALSAGGVVGLAIAAGVGQSLGKIVWYEVARRGVDSAWAQRKLSSPKVRPVYDRWVARMEGRPWFGGAVMFAAAFVGVPPLLVMAAVGGALRMPLVVFVPTIVVGRTLRFWLILVGVHVAIG